MDADDPARKSGQLTVQSSSNGSSSAQPMLARGCFPPEAPVPDPALLQQPEGSLRVA
jgi:hypothetical protein